MRGARAPARVARRRRRAQRQRPPQERIHSVLWAKMTRGQTSGATYHTSAPAHHARTPTTWYGHHVTTWHGHSSPPVAPLRFLLPRLFSSSSARSLYRQPSLLQIDAPSGRAVRAAPHGGRRRSGRVARVVAVPPAGWQPHGGGGRAGRRNRTNRHRAAGPRQAALPGAGDGLLRHLRHCVQRAGAVVCQGTLVRPGRRSQPAAQRARRFTRRRGFARSGRGTART